jgi:hypothetical protein
LADADPLGTKQNISFDQVGGLDDREFFHLSSIGLNLICPSQISIRSKR